MSMESMMKKLKQTRRYWSSGENKEEDTKEGWFVHNGSVFLKELVADCNGKSIPIRSFSGDQIIQATNNFDISCFVTNAGFHMWWYKGIIEDRPYMIKRFSDETAPDYGTKEIYNDVVLCARMSNHSNFLKLLGCCLEFSFMVLVFEYAENGVMNHRGATKVNGEEVLLPWSIRLKVGKEIANALTYLHMAFPKIIIHRDVKPVRVFLDERWNAKLSNLSFSVSIPEGKTRIETERVMGTVGYLDPSYIATNFVTEYTDVYSFGVFLMVLLTARPALLLTGSDGEYKGIVGYVKGLYENGRLEEVIDPLMFTTNAHGQRLQVEACVVLAMRCCEKRDEDRPKMIQVAKELKRIEALLRDF